MTKEKENPSTEKSQIISELANKLGFSVDLLQSVVGNRIKGTALVSEDGSFQFTAQSSTGARSETVKKTKRGSYIAKSLKTGCMQMTLKAEADSADPFADMMAEAVTLAKPSQKKNVIEPKGRILAQTPTITVRLDHDHCTIQSLVTVDVANTSDYSGAVVSEIGALMRILSQNREKILRMKNNYEKTVTKNN